MRKIFEKRIAVIGVGNEFRGDDAAGLVIAREIGKLNLPGVKMKLESGEGAALIESWHDFDCAIIVDASRSDSKPGSVFRFDARKQKMPDAFFNYSTHVFSVAEAIELARVLDRLPPELIVYAVEGKNFETGAALSPEIERAIEDVNQLIKAEILSKSKPTAARTF